jgi:hypothetical protein
MYLESNLCSTEKEIGVKLNTSNLAMNKFNSTCSFEPAYFPFPAPGTPAIFLFITHVQQTA